MKICIHSNFESRNMHNVLRLQRLLKKACQHHGHQVVNSDEQSDLIIFLGTNIQDQAKINAALDYPLQIIAFHGWYCDYSWFCPHGQTDPHIICFQSLPELWQRVTALAA